MKKLFSLILSVLMLSLIFTSCAKNEATEEPSSTEEQTSLYNGILSDFESTDIEGNKVDESVLKGKKLTMINIWATFCGPCISEMPDLGKINREYADKGFQVIGVPADVTDYYGNLDESQIDLAKEIIDETNADYIHILPSESVSKMKLNPELTYPKTIFVDENGCQVGESYFGARPEEQWLIIIDSILESM